MGEFIVGIVVIGIIVGIISIKNSKSNAPSENVGGGGGGGYIPEDDDIKDIKNHENTI